MRSSRSSTIVGKPRRKDAAASIPGSNSYFGDVVPRRRQKKKAAHSRSQPVLSQQQNQQQLTAKPLRASHSFTIRQRHVSKRRAEHRAPLVNLQRQWGVIHCGRNQTARRYRTRAGPAAATSENTPMPNRSTTKKPNKSSDDDVNDASSKKKKKKKTTAKTGSPTTGAGTGGRRRSTLLRPKSAAAQRK